MNLIHSTPMRRRASLLAMVGICAVASSARASDPNASASPQTVIETRQQGFKQMGASMKTINDQLKTDKPDTAKMTAAAAVISASSQQVLRWFPAGSGADAGIDTDALAHIWQDGAKFESLANRLISESKNLSVALSGGDLAAIKTQSKTVADTCATCHRSFRAD